MNSTSADKENHCGNAEVMISGSMVSDEENLIYLVDSPEPSE